MSKKLVSKKLGLKPLIDPTASVKDCIFGRYTEVGAFTSIAETTMGDYSYVVNNSDIIYANIGKCCSIAAYTRINPGNHPMHRATQAHFTYRASSYFDGADDDDAFFEWRRSHKVTIGHDVWIGHGAIILPGRSIGTGAVIAGGAIVTKDVAPYTIVAGNPAELIRRRFTQAQEDALMTIAWWDWDHAMLELALPDFQRLSIDAFIEKYQR